MKKSIFLLILITTLFGCQQRKQQIERLNVVRDSLTQVAYEKDSAIMEFLTGFNEIQANLDSIKTVEKLVTVSSAQPGEMNSSQKKRILEDISLLNQLLQKNKEMTANLQNKLNSANSKVGQLQGMIAEFEKMVANLNAQIEMKDVEIAQLAQDVQRLNIDVSQLTNQVQQVTQESQEKTQVINTQTVALNKAYYAIGTVKELKENNVLVKEGGVIGLGRSLKMKKDFNRDYFTEIDIRKFNVLPLMVKKVKVVSVHPVGSYHISGEKRADTLFIDNTQEFWKVSKYLLIALD
jgi:peptidoglycan hydrolase CwlO-like protein